MCGIVGYTGRDQAGPILLDGLEHLEYRGYDSAGIAVLSPDKGLQVRKAKGRLKVLSALTDGGSCLDGVIGVGHTRWATHGEPNDVNSHPHLSEDERVAVVHNGIIENYVELKSFLVSTGVSFRSETDTEVVAQLLGYYYRRCGNIFDAVYRVLDRIEGAYALGILCADMPDSFIPADKAYRLIMALCECPHGMIAMSKEMPGLVETSTNLASIKMKEGYIEVNTSQRSSIESSKHHLKWAVEQALSMACDEVTHGDGYPGWAPNPGSPLLEVVKNAYIGLFKAEPKVLAIHAGLECGLFLEKYPYLDMVSIGPQMYGVHSPQERLSSPSTGRCYAWLCQTLKSL